MCFPCFAFSKKRRIEKDDNCTSLVAPPGGIAVATWNMAAVNNNPFEYWISHDDELYVKLMTELEIFIEAPGDRDVPVGTVFTDDLFAELKTCMEREGWTGLDEVEGMWKTDYSQRLIVSGFMKDKTIGTKRLASMPDRITNTISAEDASGAKVVCRPTVVNNYIGPLGSVREWWPRWKAFMFEDEALQIRGKKGLQTSKPCQMLTKISREKYPAITEEEERLSIPLQTLCQAIFDAVLVHIMSVLSPDGRWQNVKESIVESMFKNKGSNSMKVLQRVCVGADVICLQECAATFADALKNSSLGSEYHVVVPADADPQRDQNSMLLMRKSSFPEHSECTGEVWTELGSGAPVSKGDVVAVCAKHRTGCDYLLASFHGDTNGLATNPVVDAVAASLRKRGPTTRLLFGLDANVYLEEKPGWQHVQGFLQHCDGHGLRSCWPDGQPMSECLTTCHARTYLQPQLNKAVKKQDLLSKGDVNPKDHILFRKSDFNLVTCAKDNTSQGHFLEQVPFPSLNFPSDHAVVTVVLAPVDSAKL
eukprot:CAMPEP_0194508610 /NCGR_PEP_ID=MMETSP0253-20130528/38995_1 /TAXON_ID=2966 /ORGANISM="Noctiluca scintillans" /LENGTH=534 /DNA_ID=CAMNT_0039351673 /DNA_START=40 /DNA_END=1644 /DNA_ORIENTATION=+